MIQLLHLVLKLMFVFSVVYLGGQALYWTTIRLTEFFISSLFQVEDFWDFYFCRSWYSHPALSLLFPQSFVRALLSFNQLVPVLFDFRILFLLSVIWPCWIVFKLYFEFCILNFIQISFHREHWYCIRDILSMLVILFWSSLSTWL